jgi:hypothetical protein
MVLNRETYVRRQQMVDYDRWLKLNGDVASAYAVIAKKQRITVTIRVY